MNDSIAAAPRPGPTKGRTIRRIAPNREFPSSQAASSSSYGTASMVPFSSHSVIGSAAAASTRIRPM